MVESLLITGEEIQFVLNRLADNQKVSICLPRANGPATSEYLQEQRLCTVRLVCHDPLFSEGETKSAAMASHNAERFGLQIKTSQELLEEGREMPVQTPSRCWTIV